MIIKDTKKGCEPFLWSSEASVGCLNLYPITRMSTPKRVKTLTYTNRIVGSHACIRRSQPLLVWLFIQN